MIYILQENFIISEMERDTVKVNVEHNLAYDIWNTNLFKTTSKTEFIIVNTVNRD